MPSCMMMMSCTLMGLIAFWIYEINHILFYSILFIFSTDSKVQIRLQRCAGSYGYSMLSCGVGTAVVFGRTLFQQSESQIRLRGYAGAYGYSLFSCGVGTALTFRRTFFNRQRTPDQAARRRRLIWVFAVLMWHRDIFSACDGTTKWLENIQIFL